jgi:hypothetical protein
MPRRISGITMSGHGVKTVGWEIRGSVPHCVIPALGGFVGRVVENNQVSNSGFRGIPEILSARAMNSSVESFT